jgi:hypothetical protein
MIMLPYRQSSNRRSSQATQTFGTPQERIKRRPVLGGGLISEYERAA